MYASKLNMDPSSTISGSSIQNTSPDMDPADIAQFQAIVAHQGEMLWAYQEHLTVLHTAYKQLP